MAGLVRVPRYCPASRKDDAVRKALIILGIAFLVYFVLTEPEGLADLLGEIGNGIADFFDAVMTFFTELF